MESNKPAGTANVYAGAARYSRYAARLQQADPALQSDPGWAQPFTRAEMYSAVDGCVDEATLSRGLRRLRRRVMLRTIARDIAGLADLDEVVTTISALAEVAIERGVAILHAGFVERYGEPLGADSGTPQSLHVVGMGKLGGAELNASSDIDLVLLYAEDGDTAGERSISNHEFFTRVARRLAAIIGEYTEDGFVFRVDTRLRPYGESGPLVMSFDMLENYLITQGREWERYAWIKARVLTGGERESLMKLVRPFVFRRHLDYSAFSSMRELHTQVRREVARRDMVDNIKLGAGGIREIEFIAQAFQLIRGGRDAELRRQPTLQVLAILAERGLLPLATVEELTQAYVFLRNLEHRLQYLDDQQTQSLPTSDDDRALIAEAMHFPDVAGFMAALDAHRTRVSTHFSGVFASAPEAPGDPKTDWTVDVTDSEQATACLAASGYSRPAEQLTRLSAMRDSTRYRQMPSTSQSRLDRLLPLAVKAAGTRTNPDATLERMLHLLESVARRESYLALLEQYPQALARVAELMSASPWAAQYLTQHPILLDELLDRRNDQGAPDWKKLRTDLMNALTAADPDTERQMDILRHFKQTQTIRLLIRDLAGAITLETLSDHLSELADTILQCLLQQAWQGVRQRHRNEPAFAVVAYGKLGGKELGYASDLDLVFLYEDEAPGAPENYARLAQRMNNWLTTLTAAGMLYETDLRLRPDGASGLLVSPMASFLEYQQHQAWVWEHQALTRARFVAGDPAIGASFEALRRAILQQQRDVQALRQEIIGMRQKMMDAHPNSSGLFDIKHDRGGLIDVEFAVQFLVLAHANSHETLTHNAGNIALLKFAADLGLVAGDVATDARNAYRRLRQWQHTLRLQGDTYARVPLAEAERESAAVRELWRQVMKENPA